MGIIAPDLLGTGSGWMAVTGTTHLEEPCGSPPAGTEKERELGLTAITPGRGHMRPTWSVTSLARYVGNHRLNVDPPTAMGRDLGRVTAKTLERITRTGLTTVGLVLGRPEICTLAGSYEKLVILGVICESMLEYAWNCGIRQVYKSCGMMA
jgi:hypothetical protein